MGTRSLTIMNDGDQEIAVLYRQYDGYPSVHGRWIFEALGDKTVVNGIRPRDEHSQINGAHDMAVQLIAFCKQRLTEGKPINSPGRLYLYPPGTRDFGEEFTYTLTCPTEPPGEIQVEVFMDAQDGYIFRGTMTEFGEFLTDCT